MLHALFLLNGLPEEMLREVKKGECRNYWIETFGEKQWKEISSNRTKANCNEDLLIASNVKYTECLIVNFLLFSFSSLLLSQIRIRVGEYDFASAMEPYPFVERGAKRKVVHPNYNFFTYENDLALVQFGRTS